jgi:hypothetical protein
VVPIVVQSTTGSRDCSEIEAPAASNVSWRKDAFDWHRTSQTRARCPIGRGDLAKDCGNIIPEAAT